MKNLDLEKMIILLCLLGLPITGWWIYQMKGELHEAGIALKTCKTTIAKIHGMHALITKTEAAMENAGDLERPGANQ